MTDYAVRPSPVPAVLSRTWNASVTYRECGVITEIRTYTVTIRRSAGTYTALIDGRPATVHAAANILTGARLTVTDEVRA